MRATLLIATAYGLAVALFVLGSFYTAEGGGHGPCSAGTSVDRSLGSPASMRKEEKLFPPSQICHGYDGEGRHIGSYTFPEPSHWLSARNAFAVPFVAVLLVGWFVRRRRSARIGAA
jgi:hypothetical protein